MDHCYVSTFMNLVVIKEVIVRSKLMSEDVCEVIMARIRTQFDKQTCYMLCGSGLKAIVVVVYPTIHNSDADVVETGGQALYVLELEMVSRSWLRLHGALI